MSEQGTVARSNDADTQPIKRVAVAGAGLIGSAWTGLFLAAGLEVTVWGRTAATETRVQEAVRRIWPALRRMGRTELPEPPRFTFVTDMAEAVRDADWVQENLLDDEEIKLELLRVIDASAPEHAVIASSTSGILPSLLQSACSHPERVIVGHPFFPAHIVPLVEVVGGKLTSKETLERAMAFYTRMGKKPLLCRVEAPGFITNRMQEGVTREFFHLVNDGIATTEELDFAIANGPGLRWAMFGPAFVYFMAANFGGMESALRQWDPSHVDDWAHAHYPEMTDHLIHELDVQTAQQAEGRTPEEWEALRDEFLIRVLEVKEELLGSGADAKSA